MARGTPPGRGRPARPERARPPPDHPRPPVPARGPREGGPRRGSGSGGRRPGSAGGGGGAANGDARRPRPAPSPLLPPSPRREGRGAAAGRPRPGERKDKPLCRGLTFNRSQRGSCSATYETPTQKQVVYEWFSARFPTNVRCVTGEGAASFPAAPRFPGRRALRTGPRSRRAAGRGRRGTGYPGPTEAPSRIGPAGVGPRPWRSAEKTVELDYLEEVKVVTRFP